MRIFNFSAGPSAIPTSVLEKAQKELLNYNGHGFSIMEVSHRNSIFDEVHNQALNNFKQLLNISDDYAVLFMQGGAIAQNSIIPMNLLGQSLDCSYAITGSWSHKSAIEAKKYGNVHIVCDHHPYKSVPSFESWKIDENSTYLHICTNETIDGIEFVDTPNTNVPIVADMSSHILSRQIDVSKFGVIYGGAQKNIGPSGLTFVIVKKDLINQAMPTCPSALQWKNIFDNNSMFNTPPTFSIYIAGLVFEWLLENGGIEYIEKINIQKAQMLYNFIDNSDFYTNDIDKKYRSRMNVPFFLKDETLNSKFLQQSEKSQLFGLKGHKSVGGMRASIYNAMPIEGVEKLIDFMQKFANQS